MLPFLLASSFLLSVAVSAAPTCPLDPNVCDCIPTKDAANSFDYVTCNSSQLPARTDVPSGQIYAVKYDMTIISHHAYELPSKYFSAFSSIATLGIWQDGTLEDDTPTQPPVPQEFALDAFDGVPVNSVIFQTLSNLLPIPDSLKPLGKNGLDDLGIVNHGPGRLDANSFAAFPKLTKFAVNIANLTIDPNAFSGVAGNLKQLLLQNVGLTEFPTAALSNMVALTLLSLEENRLRSIPQRAFDKFPKLQYLFLNLNPLGDAIQKGALDNLPTLLAYMKLRDVGLTKIPSTYFSTNPQLLQVDLSQNMITKIGSRDFLASPNLFTILLSDNPIDTIENGALQLLKSLRSISLTNTSITSIDFALFTGLAGNPGDKLGVDLSQTSNLKSVDMTMNNFIPSSLNIEIQNSGLETISKNFEVIFKNSKVKLDLSDNTNLKCASLDWLAPYAVCSPDMIITTNAVCADTKMGLADYLKSKLPAPCSTSSIPTTVTSTTGQNTQSTVSTKGVSQTASSIGLVIACAVIAGLKF